MLILRSQNNQEYETVKRNLSKDVEEVESSQKANSNVNATLGSSRPELVRPANINQGEIVNPAMLQNLDDKNKSDKDYEESPPSVKKVSNKKKIASKGGDKKLKNKADRVKNIQEGDNKQEVADVGMDIESDRSEDNGSGSRQKEEIGQVEVINESVSADESSENIKQMKSITKKIQNKPTCNSSDTWRSKSVKKLQLEVNQNKH